MKIYHSCSTKETERIGAEFALRLRQGDVVAFLGGLGAGKTAFVRGMAEGLHLSGEVLSPTFSLVHEYPGEPLTLYHFDMYRIESLEDLYSTGYFDYLDQNQLIAVEWSERIASVLEEGTIYVWMEPVDENSRTITIEGGDRF